MAKSDALLNTLKTSRPKLPVINGVVMEVVHASEEELDAFDKMQGGSFTFAGIPEYSRLASIVTNPHVQKIFEDASVLVRKDPKKGEDIGNAMMRDTGPDSSDHPMPNELSHKVADEGQGDDDKLAFFPVILCEFLDSIRGEPSLNPHTHLKQYFGGFIKSIAKIAAPVVGFAVGGPLGAAVGGGLGQAVASKGNIGRTLTGAGMGFLGGHAAQGLLGGLGGSSAGAGPFGDGWGRISGMTPGIQSELASKGLLGGAASGMGGIGGLGNLMSGASALGGLGGGGGGEQQSPGILGGISSFLKNNPLLVSGGMAALTAKGTKDLQKKQEEARLKNNALVNEYRRARGFA